MKSLILRLILILAVLAVAVFTAATAHAGDFVDTWVTFVFADDNLNAGAEDRSPHPGFQNVDDELFFENLDQARKGRENQSHLVLYKRMPSYFPNIDVEASFVLLVENVTNDETYENETRLSDDGSYLKMNFYFKPDVFRGDNINLTAFPVNANRFRLGYAYDITWGDNRIFPKNSGDVPGVRLKWEMNPGTDDEHYAFIGGKSARLLNDDIHERETYYGFLAGFGVSPMNIIRIEADGGYFQRGAFPPQGTDSQIGGKTAEAYGASTRWTFHKGMPIGVPVDFRLYKNDADTARLMTKQEPYDAGNAFSASAEGTYVMEALLKWDDPESSEMQPAMAGNINLKSRVGKFRIFGDAVYRDLSFILLNIPGLAPYKSFPENSSIAPEWFVAGGMDYFFATPHLTPGIMLGYKRPATYKADNVITVFRDWDDWETLPEGENPFDILSAKLTLKWDVAEFFTVMNEMRYELDNNRTKLVQNGDDAGRERVFEDSNVTNRLGFAFMVQARF